MCGVAFAVCGGSVRLVQVDEKEAEQPVLQRHSYKNKKTPLTKERLHYIIIKCIVMCQCTFQQNSIPHSDLVCQVLFFKSQKKIFRYVRKVIKETGEFLSDKELRRFFANGACYAKAVREKRSYELR